MSHIQEIPSRTVVWEHVDGRFRRIGTYGDGFEGRLWGVSYAGFANAEDAKHNRNPVTRQYNLLIKGALVDRFFWAPEMGAAGEYNQSEARVGACLVWLFTGNPTASELALTENLEAARAAMAGVEMFGGAFTVTPLPAERAEEE